MNRSTIRNAIELLKAAIALDPTYAQAKALAAICHGDLVQQRWDDPGDFTASDRLAKEALAVARDDPIVLAFASQIVAYISKDYETALAAADRALAICPNSFVVSSRCGWVKLYVGQAGEAVDCFLRAIRLSPLDPYTFNAPVGMAAARLMEGKPEEANAGPARPFSAMLCSRLPTASLSLRSLSKLAWRRHGKHSEKC